MRCIKASYDCRRVLTILFCCSSIFRLSVVKRKQTSSRQPIRWKENKRYYNSQSDVKKNTLKSQWKLKVKVTKLLKARENAGDQVVIGWECGASFMDQSQSEVKQNQQISGNFPYSLLYLQSWALLVTHEVFISCVQWNKNLKTFLVVGTIFCALPEGRKGVSIDTFSVKQISFHSVSKVINSTPPRKAVSFS